MNFVRIESENEKMFWEAMKLYHTGFPEHEQRKEDSQKEILQDPGYHFNLIYDGETFVGILLCWENADFIYVEHFCIDEKLRNKQYGQRTLALLNAEADGKKKTVILEIDPPVDEISKRRKGFYERAQYQENAFAHIHPPYREKYEGHSLVVMSYPAPLTETAYQEFAEYLRETVMR